MGSAKDILVRRIDSRYANDFIRRNHYSGKTAPNSQLHFGVFLGGQCLGVMQLGPSLDSKKMLSIVRGARLGEFLELNRMAFHDTLPRNSESRAIGYVVRGLKKERQELKFIISFADATQCGDGTIYRASGFLLCGIKQNHNLAKLPEGEIIHKMTLESSPLAPRPELGGRSYFDITGGKYTFKAYVAAVRGKILPGYQLKYILPLSKESRANLALPIIPYSKIAELGIGMYRGKKRAESIDSNAAGFQPVEDGANPISALQ